MVVERSLARQRGESVPSSYEYRVLRTDGEVRTVQIMAVPLQYREQSATLAVVAPAIAEALIATAMGLFAAIPAVIAYNRYADKVVRLEIRYDGFMEEFSSILQRHSRSQKGT